MYSQTVRRLVASLPNRGGLPDPSHSAEGANPVCGDTVRLELRVAQGRVRACRFTGSGCPAALAAAAAVTELVEGNGVEECARLNVETLLEYLGGLPPHKRHGAELAVDVLRRALGPLS
jgi:NifU-like protein involved in Fe-S cluster formation